MRYFLLFVLLVAHLGAQTTYNSDGSQADVASKITGASNGDTITLPSGTFTWTSGVTITGKYLSITGAGSGRVLGYSTSSNSVGTGAKTWTTTAGLAISNGQSLRIYRTGGELNGSGFGTGNYIWCQGTVTSYSGTSLVMNITSVSSVTGTYTSWDICSLPNTTIINNGGSANVISVVQNGSGSTEISDIQFQVGTGTGDMIFISSSGEPTLIHDCWIEATSTSGDAIESQSNSGVAWNCSIYAPSFSAGATGLHHKAPGLTTSWTTASTMGAADTTGKNNFYMENCDFTAFLNASDMDDNARQVFRYCTYKYAGVGSHGADTSNYGGRHSESYYNTYTYDNQGVNSPNNTWWFYIRGGTWAISNCTIPVRNSGGTWGSGTTGFEMTVQQLQRNAGPNGGWGVINTSGRSGGWNYPSPRQPGFGRVTGSQVFPSWTSGGPYPGPGATWSGNYVTFSGATYKSTTANTSTSNPVVNSGQWNAIGYAAGFDSFTYIGDSEPIYIWSNTPTAGSAPVVATTDYGANGTNSVSTTAVPITCDTSANYIQANRDYFYNTSGTSTGAKPGYSYYTYPHPLRTDLGPQLVSAIIPSGGTSITYTYDEAVDSGADGFNTGLTLSASGGAVTATYGSGATTTALVYNLSRPVDIGETITTSYTQPGDGIIADTGGLPVDSYSSLPVTNNSTQGGATGGATMTGTVTVSGGVTF